MVITLKNTEIALVMWSIYSMHITILWAIHSFIKTTMEEPQSEGIPDLE